MKPQSFLLSIGTSAFWKSLDRLSGLIKHVVIASAIGLSAQLDVFYIGLAFLGVLIFSWASLLDVLAVPRLVELWQRGEKTKFHELTGGMLALCLMGSLLLAIALYFGNEIIASLAIGFDANRKELLAAALLWFIPVALFYIPLRFIGSIARALRHFSAFYQAEFFAGLVVLICVALFRDDPNVLYWSFSLGITLAFFYLLFRTRKFIGAMGNPFSPGVRACLNLAPGLLILQGAQYVYVLSDRIFVSFLPDGAVSALTYGMTLVALIPGIIVVGGSFITVMAEKMTPAERSSRLNDVISMSIYFSIAATAFMVLFGQEMVKILLERGLFTPADTLHVGSAILGYAWMILPMFLIVALDQAFQVEKKISFMVRRTVLGLIINAILSAIFLFGFGWGILGVALATSISYWVMLLSSLEGITRLGYNVAWVRHARWLLWMTVLMAVLYGFSYVSTGMDELLRLLLGIAVMFSLMLAGGYFYFGCEGLLVRNSLRRIFYHHRSVK